MILDSGIATIWRVFSDGEPGGKQTKRHEKLLSGWYGDRVVGFSRFFAAKQANTKVDRMIRILRPVVEVRGDDLCEVGGAFYRIVQAQYTRDVSAGEDVVDLTLERMVDGYGIP